MSHMGMCRVTHVNASCHARLCHVAHVNMSCAPYELSHGMYRND